MECRAITEIKRRIKSDQRASASRWYRDCTRFKCNFRNEKHFPSDCKQLQIDCISITRHLKAKKEQLHSDCRSITERSQNDNWAIDYIAIANQSQSDCRSIEKLFQSDCTASKAVTQRLHSFQSRNTAIAQHFKSITVRLQSDYRANVKDFNSISKRLQNDCIAIAKKLHSASEAIT